MCQRQKRKGKRSCDYAKKSVDNFHKCVKISKILQSNTEKKRHMPSMSDEGTVRALGSGRLRATSVRPGMTGTGAPVTEQIEMLSLQ